MGIFSGEGLDLNFPPGRGAIFQPRGGPGGGPNLRDFSYSNLDIYNNIGVNKKCGASRKFFAKLDKTL